MLSPYSYIEKMRNWPFCIGVNLLLAITIFLCALLGRSLGIQGPVLAISVVWPATGVAVAALLIFGNCAWLGVFIGNLVYNFLFFSIDTTTHPLQFPADMIAATTVSSGSLLQALLSAYLIRTYSTPIYFRNVHDIFIFLIPASALVCLIGSTIGVATLIVSGGLKPDLIVPIWIAFWLGDTVGIYVMTPLLVVWSLQSPKKIFSEHLPSLFCMAIIFILLAIVTYIYSFPLPHLFLPISIWAAYLFRMHGASLVIFFMTTASVTFAVLLQGSQGTTLIGLISFIGVTIAAALIIAAVVNEREEALALLLSRNIYLEQEVDVRAEMLDSIRSQASQGEHRHSQLSETSGKVLELMKPMLKDIGVQSQICENSLVILQQIIHDHISLSKNAPEILDEKIAQIRSTLQEIHHAMVQLSNNVELLKKSL